MGGGGRQVWVTFAIKDAKVVVGGHGAKEGSVWCGEPERLGGQNVEKVGGCLQSFDPVGGWKGGLKQKAAHNIVERTDEALSLTVLRRGVGTGHAEVYAVGEEERARAGVVELLAIVALNFFDGGAKLGSGIGDEVRQRTESVRLKA